MSNFLSLIFYIVTFIFSSMVIGKVGKLYKKDKKNKGMICLLTIIGLAIPIIISALRYYVGTDYENYMRSYERFSYYSLYDILTEGQEILFLVVIKIAALFNNYQIIFFIMAFLTVVIMYFTLFNYKEKLSLGFMFFIYLFMYFTSSFNLVKQCLAVVIVAYSYKFIFNREGKKFLITIIIASLFHVSAFLFLPFYFVVNKADEKKAKYIRICYIIITAIVVLNYQRVVGMISSISIFSDYGVYANEVESANREAILSFAILIVILCFRKQLIKYDKRNEVFIFFAIINSILLLIGFVTPYAKRIAEYFGISNIFIFASFPKLAKNKQQELLIYFLISLYAISLFVMSVYILGQAHIIPYQTIIGK